MDDKSTATPFGPVVEITGVDNVISPSEIFFWCEQKSDYAFQACQGVGRRPWNKTACDTAAEELRRCLQANADVIKALAALRHGKQWRTTMPSSSAGN
jgi:hypothetical protein